MSNKKTFGPYSLVRRIGNTYYVSGQVGVNPKTKENSLEVTEQTVQVLENLKSVLSEQGLTMEEVVKTTIYLVDMGDYADVNKVYAKYFISNPPARSCVAVTELPRVGNNKLIIEIEAIAYKE